MDICPKERTANFHTTFPHELLLLIFQYLDLISLRRCLAVCKNWYNVGSDRTLHESLIIEIKRDTNGESILNSLINRRHLVKKLVILSHKKCEISTDVFQNFLQHCCQETTHLKIDHDIYMSALNLIEMALISFELHSGLRNDKLAYSFSSLKTLNKLVSLDLSGTRITDQTLIEILYRNYNLKYLNLDYTFYIKNGIAILFTAAICNPQLVTFSSAQSLFWSTDTNYLSMMNNFKFNNLKILNLNAVRTTSPEFFLLQIAISCPQLETLNLNLWSGINDQMLLPILKNCKNLKRLSLKSVKSITTFICEEALKQLPQLVFLDISYNGIDYNKVFQWRQKYPHIVVKTGKNRFTWFSLCQIL